METKARINETTRAKKTLIVQVFLLRVTLLNIKKSEKHTVKTNAKSIIPLHGLPMKPPINLNFRTIMVKESSSLPMGKIG